MRGIIEKDKRYVENTYSRFNLAITGGKGSVLFGADGREYIDMNTGIAVNTFGAADEAWIAAVEGQLRRVQHTSNLYYSEPCAALAEMLSKKTGCGKVFFSNSGAEANECAVKAARLWAEKNKGGEYFNIITLKNGFHGRTMATLSATGQSVFHEHFTPMLEGFSYAEPGDAAGLEILAAKNKCAAVFMELVQGEGGVTPLEKAFVQKVSEICKKYDLLIMIDEVQTGNGRTGTLYAYEQYGLSPDIVTTAKGLGGGLPIGATLFFERTAGVLTAGQHGSTFGGNPVCCAGALSVLSRIDDKLLFEVREKSAYIRGELEGAAGVKSVSGLGLMLGIETECEANKVIALCMERGVLPIKAKNKIRLLPALNIPWDVLKRAVSIIKECIKDSL